MADTDVIQPDASGIARAGDLLANGRLVAFPTETVYGLGADAQNDRAVAAIYEAKGRPSFNPLIVHVPDLDTARDLAVFTDKAEVLAKAFWPGALTLVLPLKPDSGISKLVTAGHDTVAIRVPAHDTARALLRAAGHPLAAPSANPSGRISPTIAEHVMQGLSGRIAAVLDGGPCSVGVESTILDAGEPVRLLRPGGIPRESIQELVGEVQEAALSETAPNAPGQLASHYAPAAVVRLNAVTRLADEVFLGFGGTEGATMDLSPSGDLLEAAANLFGMLHRLDAMGKPIAVAPIPETGLGHAINDRLRRAAAPRGQ